MVDTARGATGGAHGTGRRSVAFKKTDKIDPTVSRLFTSDD